jgi:outer membrane protein assembly factor BamB
MSDWLLRDRNANRHAFVKEALKLPLQKSWETVVFGSVIAPPVSAESHIYVCSLGAIHKLDLLTGNHLWHYRHKEPPKPRRNAIKASPAIWSDRVYFTDSMGIMYCLKRDSGQLLWANEQISARNESICIYEDKLFTRFRQGEPDNGTYGYACLDPDGQLIWFHPCSSPIRTDAAAIKDGKLIFGDMDGSVYALNTTNGELIWKTDIKSLIDDTSLLNEISTRGLPMIIGNTVILRVGDDRNFGGFDLSTGRIKWHHVADPVNSAHCVAIDQNKMYYFLFSGLWQSVDIETGQTIASVDHRQHLLGESMSLSGLVVDNYYIAGFNMSRKLVVINTTSSKIEWMFTGTGGYSAPAIFADSKLVIGSDDGKIYCFEENK